MAAVLPELATRVERVRSRPDRALPSVTGANITCVVDNLEKEDLVKRVPSKKDRRVINAELTSKGEEKVKKLFPQYSKGFDDSFSRLTKDDKKQLVKILDKIA